MIMIIDIGSNTVKAMLYNEEKLVSTKRVKLQLMNKIVDGELSQSGIIELSKTLKKLKSKDANTYAYATSAIRDAKNKEEIINYIKLNNNLEIDVLSGYDEAKYTFDGVINHTHRKSAAIVDIGGGSTELIIYKKKKIEFIASYNLGCVRLSDMGSNLEYNYIKKVIKNNYPLKKSNIILGRGGTITRGIKLIEKVYHVKRPVEVRYFYKFIKKYTYNKKNAQKDIQKYVPEREDSIIAGFIILTEIAKTIGAKNITAVNHGLKDGYLDKIRRDKNANL